MVNEAINQLAGELTELIGNDAFSLYLYGSAMLDDFRHGWSDIDILCLTENQLASDMLEELVNLRQSMCKKYLSNVYRLFEGGILPAQAFLSGSKATSIYWGTSGQRITGAYTCDSFARWELKNRSQLVYGRDALSTMVALDFDELLCDILRHYQTIRKYAVVTGPNLYSCGWLLDIARCLHTLQTGSITSKTAAGQWALDSGLCNVPDSLKRALMVRRAPLRFKDDPEFCAWASTLGNDIQRFADVLQAALNNSAIGENK